MSKLDDVYQATTKKFEDGSNYQYFTEGYTASAVDMRARALALVQDAAGKAQGPTQVLLNDLVNKIGSLSDIG